MHKLRRGCRRTEVVELRHKLRREVSLALGVLVQSRQGFVVIQSRSHMEASGRSNKFQMQPFSAVGFVFGFAGGLATTIRVGAHSHLDLFWNGWKGL